MSKKGSIPTDEEIKAMMDFDGLIRAHTSQAAPIKIKQTRLAKGLVVAGAVVLISVLTYLTMKQNPSATSLEPVNNQASPTGQVLDPTQSDSVHHSPIEPASVLTDSRQSKASQPIDRQIPTIPLEQIYVVAEPIEGFPHLYDYFDRELKYPQQALSDSIQGVETVAFLIDKSGKPGKFEILQSLGEVFDLEVIRLLQNMPTWKPATLNGQPVMSKQSVPFTFKITRISETKK